MTGRKMEIALRDLHTGTRITCPKVGIYREARVYRVEKSGPARVRVSSTGGVFNLPAGSLVTVHCGPRY